MMAPAIRYEEARDRLKDALVEVGRAEIVTRDKALGRIAGRELASGLDLPNTENAAVDGYCVSSAFLANNPDFAFEIAGVAKAGHPFDEVLEDGQALRIFTGAVMPKGADCVMMQEFCLLEDGKVRFPKPMMSGKNCRPAGENLAKGEVIIAKGEVISASHIGQLAAAGIKEVPVIAPLRVGILSTGDELIEADPDLPKDKGQIYDSNRPMLAAMIEQAGHQVVDGGIIKDTRKALGAAYQELSQQADLIISSGGASQGDEDHSQDALQDIGAKPIFWRVAIKPGRPVAAAILGNVPIFALPGNPVAVFVCFHLFVNASIGQLSHGVFTPLKPLYVKAGFSVKKVANDRAEFRRVKLALTNEGETVMLPHGRKGAGVLSSLTGADGLAELPFELGEVPEGHKLPFIML